MKKIKAKAKNILLEYTIKYVGKNRIINSVLNSKEKEGLKHLKRGFLYKKGWWVSWESKSPLDIEGHPLPWVTYSFIDFITPRLNKKMILFEYGSGNSTLYYSNKVKEVHTVEHEQEWYNKIKKIMPSNVELSQVDLEYGGKYSLSSSKKGVKYDIIIVDGRDRVNCINNSLKNLNNGGVIILDDSEREKYREGIEKLYSLGYKSIDLWGISPGFISYNKCTSIYYKKNNNLGI